MSLLPDVERELMRAARAPDPVEDEQRRPGRAGLVPLLRRSLPTAAVVLVVLAAVAVGGVFLAGLRSHGTGHGPAGHGLRSSEPALPFGEAPTTQRGSWLGGGNLCPLAAPNRYLPPHSGCVSAGVQPVYRVDIRDLVMVYAHLSDRRVDGLYVPRFFTLEIRRPDGAVLRARLPQSQSNPALLFVGTATFHRQAKVFIETGHISSGWSAVIYSVWQGRLVPAGVNLGMGGDSATISAFQCHDNPPVVVQRTFELTRGGEDGWWRQTDTTFAWRGARLVQSRRTSSLRHGAPPAHSVESGIGCTTIRPEATRMQIVVEPTLALLGKK